MLKPPLITRYKEKKMARGFIQKRFTTTVVKGFYIKDGKPCEVEFEMNSKCKLNRAQAIIRKTEPTFSAASIEETSKLYKMSVEDFKAHATIVDDEE
jgi:hypothetical protein